MNFRDVLGEIARNFAAQPLLSVTLFGVIFASVYLLLMLMTRLGDVRRGLQSFILSAVIHLLVILALGEVVPRTIRSAAPPAEQLVEIPIREVILEERSELSNSEEGKSPLLEMLPEPSREEFERRDQPSPAGETMPKPGSRLSPRRPTTSRASPTITARPMSARSSKPPGPRRRS